MRIGDNTNLATDWGDFQDPGITQARANETLAQVATRLGVNLADLQSANPQITDPSKLTPGSEIRIPAPAADVSVAREETPAPVNATSRHVETSLEANAMRSLLSSSYPPNVSAPNSSTSGSGGIAQMPPVAMGCDPSGIRECAERTDSPRTCPVKVLLVAGGQADVGSYRQSPFFAAHDLVFAAKGNVADSGGGFAIEKLLVAGREKCRVRWDLRIRRIERVHAAGWPISWTFEAGDVRIGIHSLTHVQNGNRNRDVKTIGDAKGRDANKLIHPQIDAVLRTDDIFLEDRLTVGRTGHDRHWVAKFRFAFVLKDGAEVFQVDAVDLVEIEILIAEPDKELVLADRVGSLGQNRSEAFGLTRHNTQGRIEREQKARNRGRDGQVADLRADFGVERRKALQGGIGEVCRMAEVCGRHQGSAVVCTDEAAGSVNLRDQANQISRPRRNR